jgi:hypothetical protein
MLRRRDFILMLAVTAACLGADDAHAKGGNRKYWRAKKKGEQKADLPKFCSERRTKGIVKCDSNSLNKERCHRDLAIKYENCLSTGKWKKN